MMIESYTFMGYKESTSSYKITFLAINPNTKILFCLTALKSYMHTFYNLAFPRTESTPKH